MREWIPNCKVTDFYRITPLVSSYLIKKTNFALFFMTLAVMIIEILVFGMLFAALRNVGHASWRGWPRINQRTEVK